MRQRPFGNTGLSVSELGFGCAAIGAVFQGAGRSQTVHLLREALEAGITLFDTADMYTQGESERLLAEAFHGQREQVVIATKFGFTLPAQKQIISRMKPLIKTVVRRLGLRAGQFHAGLRGSVSQQDFSAEHIARAVEGSLKRLKTDYIDVYQLHSPPAEVLQRGDFVESLDRLRRQGKIRYWGIACEQPSDVLTCLQYASLNSVQVGLSVLEQTALDAAIPAAARQGVAIIARQVFASGLLTRPAMDIKPDLIDSDPVVGRLKHEQLVKFAETAAARGRSKAEMALKFDLSNASLATVLLGISRQEQLAAALRALEAPALTEDEHRQLTACRRPGP